MMKGPGNLRYENYHILSAQSSILLLIIHTNTTFALLLINITDSDKTQMPFAFGLLHSTNCLSYLGTVPETSGRV